MMFTPTNKQASSIGETLHKVWDDTSAYHPGIYGALGGAAFAGLGTMGRRANENPRQRALRILRNAAAGGLLGGMGTQLTTRGLKQVGDNMVNPNQTQPAKPGFFSSIPARLGYMGTATLAGNSILRRRNLLNSLQEMLPVEGLGKIEYKKHDAGIKGWTRAGSLPPVPSGEVNNIAPFPELGKRDSFLDTNNRKAVAQLSDQVFRNVARNDPKGFESLLEAIQKKTMNANGVVDTNLLDFLRANYSRGEKGHPISVPGGLRVLNFLGVSSPNKWTRGLGLAGSLGLTGLAGVAPNIVNKATETMGEQADKAPGRLLNNPLAEQVSPAEETWIDQLTKGRKVF